MRSASFDDVRAEPYRVLFPLGIAAGISGVAHWLLLVAGRPGASGGLHVALQIPAYVGAVAAGFLATALPRLAGAPPASRAEFAALVALCLALAVAPLWNDPRLVGGLFAALLVHLLAFAGRRLPLADRRPPPTFAWIGVGAAAGLAGAGLLAADHPVGRAVVGQGFILPLVLGVAPVIGPVILGLRAEATLQTRCAAPARRPPIARPAVIAILIAAFAASFVVEARGAAGPAYLLRAAIVGLGLAPVLAVPPSWRHPQRLFFQASLLSTVAGLAGAGLRPDLRVTLLHLTFVGGFSLMILMVMTRVVTVHGGRRDLLDRPYAPAWAMGALVLAAAAARVAADVWPAFYLEAIGAAVLLWIAAHVVFLAGPGRRLFLSPL